MSDLEPSFIYDLIIAGAGAAGLTAAIFASRRGASVLVLEAAPYIGGTLHKSSGQVSAAGTRVQQAKGIVDTSDEHYEDIMRITRGLADPQMVRLTVDNAPAALNWLLESGLKPLSEHPVTGAGPFSPGYSKPRCFWGEQKGLSILNVLESELAHPMSKLLRICLETRVTDLIVSDAGAVEGVRGTSNGADTVFRGRQVLLTTGGYAMNPELFERLTGDPAYVARAHPFSVGDGLQMATRAGAALRGQSLRRAGTGSILTTDRFPASVYAKFITSPDMRPPWEIWVDNNGRRFIREDEPDMYAREQAVLSLPKLRYAIIFDRTILDMSPVGVEAWSREKMLSHFGSHPMFHSSETLQMLGEKASLNSSGLLETVASYNAAVSSERDMLGRQYMPAAILTPPFYAIIHYGHTNTSSAGLLVDNELRVLTEKGETIPGLYAAGEILGAGITLGQASVPAMMLAPALSFGMRIGQRLPVCRL
jgi:fumarate reductase flavoprotein subunit